MEMSGIVPLSDLYDAIGPSTLGAGDWDPQSLVSEVHLKYDIRHF